MDISGEKMSTVSVYEKGKMIGIMDSFYSGERYADGIKELPLECVPGSAKKSEPALTCRESNSSELTLISDASFDGKPSI